LQLIGQFTWKPAVSLGFAAFSLSSFKLARDGGNHRAGWTLPGIQELSFSNNY
jgi:hypothetical protein